MKKPLKTALVFVGLLMGVLFLMWWKLRDRELRRSWPGIQLTNAVTIGRKLWPYREAHGKYPERLSDLVADGIFKADELESLRFQSAPGAPREDWIYQVPGRMEAITIESPRSLGELGYRIIVRADGGGQLVRKEWEDKHIRKREQALMATYGSEAIEAANSISPDGFLAARVEAGTDFNHLCFYQKASGTVLARLRMGSYARYPMAADPSNLQVLWSPDSMHFALMIRSTKNSWTMTAHAVENNGVREIPLLGATAKALEMVSASETYR